MSFIHWDTFADVIIPTLQKKDVAFIGISTQSAKETYFSDFLKASMPGDASIPAFNVINWVSACTDCQVAKKSEYCDHIPNDKPWWISTTSQLATIMYQNDKTRALREMYNTIAEANDRSVFDKRVLEDMKNLDVHCIDFLRNHNETPAEVYILVDPAKGSDTSDFAAVAWMFAPDLHLTVRMKDRGVQHLLNVLVRLMLQRKIHHRLNNDVFLPKCENRFQWHSWTHVLPEQFGQMGNLNQQKNHHFEEWEPMFTVLAEQCSGIGRLKGKHVGREAA